MVIGGLQVITYGDYSFAGGKFVTATAKGSFVWADSSSNSTLVTNTTDQFYVRSQGGFYVDSSSVTLLGSTTIGSQLTLAGSTLTVQGNAFSVGGSTFVVIGSSVGIRTASPAATLDVAGSVQIGSGTAKSTFTAGGLLMLTGAGIQWADGSTSTTAASSASSLAASSTTNIPANGITQGTFIICQATVTITTTGNKVAVFAAGIMNQSAVNSSNVHFGFNVLQDGAYVSPYDASHGITGWADGGQNYHDLDFYAILQTAPSAASHSYCLAMANDSGRSMVVDTSFSKAVFGALEVR